MLVPRIQMERGVRNAPDNRYSPPSPPSRPAPALFAWQPRWRGAGSEDRTQALSCLQSTRLHPPAPGDGLKPAASARLLPESGNGLVKVPYSRSTDSRLLG